MPTRGTPAGGEAYKPQWMKDADRCDARARAQSNFMGMSVVIDEKFAGSAVLVPRTWRERLFTRPWHPFTKFTAVPGEPEFFVDSYHNRLYTCRRGLDALDRAITARNELARKYA